AVVTEAGAPVEMASYRTSASRPSCLIKTSPNPSVHPRWSERCGLGGGRTVSAQPSIVFCHGLWADGSCFNKLIVPLQAEGYECIAAQYGLNTTSEDVTLTKATIGRVSGPVILVGHSYGGSVITGAGTDDRVAGLVYICALAPDADETSQTQQSKSPRTEVFSQIEVVDGRIWLKREGTKQFCGDLPEAAQKLVWATQGVPRPDLFDARVGGTAWRSKPSWYIV